MRIEQLHLKPTRSAPMIPVRSAIAIEGIGLANDCNASPSSPRQVLIVSTATLAKLRVDAADLRANFVVNADIDALPSGAILRVGDVRIRLTLSCEPCRKLETVRKGLARDVCGIRGMLGRIIAGGEVRVGDRMDLESATLPRLEEKWQARVMDILRKLPDRHHVTFARLAEVAGLQSTYCRAFPGLLRRLAGTNLPIERVVSLSKQRPVGTRTQKQQATEPSLWDGASYFLYSERSLP